MHSFHRSRGRILFEVACALTISASCVGAWLDLGVSAFLPAAAVSALYALVHLFDLRDRKPAVAFAAPAVELDVESQGDLLAYADAPAPAPVVEPAPSIVELVENAAPAVEPEPEPVADVEAYDEPVPTPKPRSRKRKSTKKAEPVAKVEPVDEPEPAVDSEPTVEAEPFTEVESSESEVCHEPEDHAPVTPLFEPEPFVRQQQRAVFGRKAS